MDSHDVVALIGDLAWPATVALLVVLLRREVRSIAQAMRDRIADRSTDVAITRSGVEIHANLDAMRARVDTLEVGQDQQSRLLLTQVSGSSVSATGIDAELRSLAADYLRIDIPDWAERTRVKDEAANELGLYVVSHQVPRDDLAREVDEGLILALASAVLLDPQPADADRMLVVSSYVNRLHVRYRVLLAFSRLFERRMLDQSQLARLRGVLAQFRIGADDSLRRRIDWTESLIDSDRAA